MKLNMLHFYDPLNQITNNKGSIHINIHLKIQIEIIF